MRSQGPSRSQPGAAMIPGVSTTREPTVVTASITASVKKYISTLVVHPVRSSSTQPAAMPARTSSARSLLSAGHMTSCSHRMSGRSPPSPRSAIIGVCACVLINPGSRTPGRACTAASDGGASASGPTQAIRPSASMSRAASRRTEHSASQGRTTGAVRRKVTAGFPRATAATGTAAARPRRRGASPARCAAAARGRRPRCPRGRRTRSHRRPARSSRARETRSL